MQVYKDFDDVVKPTEVPKKLWKYEDGMKQKPNFDKNVEKYYNTSKGALWRI